MITELKEEALLLVIGLLLGAFIALKLFAPKVEEHTTVTEDTSEHIDSVRVDTVWQVKYKYLKAKEVTAKTEESPEGEKYDSIRTYRGTHLFDYGKFDWEVQTGGIMLTGKFNPVFDIPIKTITNTKTITQTRTIIQKGLFLGGGFSTQQDYHFGGSYLGKKYLIEYNYTPAMGFNTQPEAVPVHQFGFKYKVF